MPGGCGKFANFSALERDIHYSYKQKVEADDNREILPTKIPHIQFIVLIYPEGGAWYS